MRFLTFKRVSGAVEPGVLSDGKIVALTGAGFASVISVIEGGSKALSKVAEYVSTAPSTAKLDPSAVHLLAPVPKPNKIFCIGLNYRDHATESNMEIPKVPTVFSKFTNSVIGSGETIILPKDCTQPDYEAEFALVIGKGGRRIAAADWQQHVFGYMNLNDVSARDLQLATTQWLMGKSPDTFAPMGPYLVTADEVADPHSLDIKMIVSGEVLQHSNTKHLIFPIPVLIEYISRVITLEPGDVISTGTPAGVGFARKPPRLLRDGDECVVEVEGLGRLVNPVALEA